MCKNRKRTLAFVIYREYNDFSKWMQTLFAICLQERNIYNNKNTINIINIIGYQDAKALKYQ